MHQSGPIVQKICIHVVCIPEWLHRQISAAFFRPGFCDFLAGIRRFQGENAAT
jgi:hypothetical protein